MIPIIMIQLLFLAPPAKKERAPAVDPGAGAIGLAVSISIL